MALSPLPSHQQAPLPIPRIIVWGLNLRMVEEEGGGRSNPSKEAKARTRNRTLCRIGQRRGSRLRVAQGSSFRIMGLGSVKYWYVCSTSLAHFSFLPTQLLRQGPETRQNTRKTVKKIIKTNGDNKMRKHKRIMKKKKKTGEKTETLCL